MFIGESIFCFLLLGSDMLGEKNPQGFNANEFFR